MRWPAGRPYALVSSFFVCLQLMMAPATAHAADHGATIRVQVEAAAAHDVSAAVVVTLDSSSVPDRSWTARIDPGGTATFRNLPTATYRVSATPAGGTARSIDVAVLAGEAATVAVRFAAQTATLRLVSLGRIAEGLTFAGRTLTGAPAASSLWGLLDAADPFVIVDRMDNGGLMTAASGLVGSRGASWTTLTMALGDAAIAGPDKEGRVMVQPDLAAIESVTVATGLAPVEFGSPGAAVILEPKRPGAAPHGEFDVATTRGGMAGQNTTPATPPIVRLDSWTNVSGQAGAPVTPRAGVFVAVDATRSEQQSRAETFSLPGNLTSVFANGIAHPTAADEFRASAAVQGSTAADDGRIAFANRDVTTHDTLAVLSAAWEHVTAVGRRLVSVSMNQGSNTPDVTGTTAGGVVDRVFDGVVPDAPTKGTVRRVTGTFEFDPLEIRRGVGHTFRFGAIVQRTTAGSSLLEAPIVAETVDGLPARVWMTSAPASPTSSRHVNDVTGYASDLMQLASRLTFEAGLRANLTSGSANGAAGGVSWKTLAPRASLRWATDTATLFAAYGLYYAPLSTDWLAFGDPGSPTAKVYRWTDANGDGRFEPGEQGPLVSVAGWGQSTGSIDPSLRAPVTNEVTFGVDRWFGTTVRVHAAATIRHERNIAAAVDTGVPLSSYTTSFILDQGEDYFGSEDDRFLPIYNRLPSSFALDRYVLTNPAGDSARYEGFEVAGEVRGTHVSSIVGAMAYLTRAGAATPGFTALENDQDVIGDRYVDPNAAPFEPGSVFFDRSYVLKWTTAYDNGRGFHAAATARYQDGQPFTRLVIAPNVNQGPDVIQAYRVGRTRFYFTFTLDAEIAQRIALGRGRSIELVASAFNLTNQASEVEENPVTGPSFRLTTAVQPPRVVRIGVRFKF